MDESIGKPIDISVERSLELSPGDGWMEQSRVFIRIYNSIVETGLLAEIDGNALKVLIALGLQATTLWDGPMFEELKAMGLVDDGDKGKLICYASQEDLAARCGMSRQTLVSKAKTLVALGLVEKRTARTGEGKFSGTLFIIKEGVIGKFGKGSHVKKFDTADHRDRVKKFDTGGHRVKKFDSINEDNNIAVVDDDIHQQQQQQKDKFFKAAKTFDTAEKIFSAFARAFGLADYRPSERDYRVLEALYEGYSDEEILAGIERAAAYARRRGTVPRSFAYVAAAVRRADADSAGDTVPPTGTDAVSGAGSPGAARGRMRDGDTVPETEELPDTVQVRSGDTAPHAATAQLEEADADSAEVPDTVSGGRDTVPGAEGSLPEDLRQTLNWLGVRGGDAWLEITEHYARDPNRVRGWVKFIAERWKNYENAPGFLRSMLRSGEQPPPDREEQERYSILHGKYANLIKS